jgi:hypothetical protein
MNTPSNTQSVTPKGPRGRRHLRTLLSGAVVAGALVTAGAATAATTGGSAIQPHTPSAQISKAGCQGISFTVLHNDRSGGVVLPAGQYRVSSPNLGCKTASNYFTTFLNKYNGKIPGWSGQQKAKGFGTYTKNNTKTNFAVKLVKSKTSK